MVGYAFMGRMHSQAWRTVGKFFDLPANIELRALAGRSRGAVEAAAQRMEFASTETDWQALIARDDIDIIDICVPGHLHHDIAIAALEAGKHVLCEKPLATTVAEALEMTAAAVHARTLGVLSMCGFTYRRTPALSLAKRLVDEGRLGTIRQVRAQYLQDWLSDEDAPLTWRLDKTKAGSGSLGDIGAHSIDMAEWVSGQRIIGVSGMLETFVSRRPITGEFSGLGGVGATGSDAPRGPVTVDDAALFTTRLDGGAIGVFEASRFALGHKNAVRLEVNGTLGSIAFDFEDNNTLHYYDATDAEDVQGYHKINVTGPVHPYTGNWWPVGHGLGYEHAFIHQAADFIGAITTNVQPEPSFGDALHVQRVMQAIQDSSDHQSTWTNVSANQEQEN